MSEDGSGSPERRAIKNIFKPRRASKGGDSFVEGDDGAVVAADSPSFVQKLRIATGKDTDDSDGSSTKRKLSKVFRKRGRKDKVSTSKPAADSTDAIALEEEALRGRKPFASSRSLPASSVPGTPGEHSEGASLMTSDSEDEATMPTATSPPTLVSRPSHAGYLVATSPSVRATTTTAISGGGSPLTHSPSLPVNPFDPPSQPVPGLQHGWTMAGKLSLGTPSGRKQSRSVSPGARIKDALKVSSRRTSPSKAGSPDRKGKPEARGGVEVAQIGKTERPSSTTTTTTSGSVNSLPTSLASHGTDSSIPPVPPMPSSPPSITINGSGLGSKQSLSSVVINPGTPGKSPTTTVTPPTPVIGPDDNEDDAPRTPPLRQSPKVGTGASLAGISGHRRTRSDSSSKQPSKLSQSMNVPLTPTAEEPPGSIRSRNISNVSNVGGGGFFSSMLNAAQNMTTTITNISNRPRTTTFGSGTESIPEEKEDAEVETTHGTGAPSAAEPSHPLAIDTIGSGNLSLSHLGITTDSPQSLKGPESDGLRSRSGTLVRHEEAAAQAEDVSAAQAISSAYVSGSDVLNRPATAVVEDVNSINERSPSQQGSIIAKTPPNGSIYEGENGGILRSGSLRGKIAERKRRKHRNSSGATIGAAIAASHGTIATPGRAISGVIANTKRDRDFHQFFRSVPEDDRLVEDYSCALQRDILLAGRLYVSEGHICFASNILGWITNLVISFDEIVSVEKESTAMVFPNAIVVQTLHQRHTFRSLLTREATYDLIIAIWKSSHPNLQTTETGTKLLSGTDVANGAKSDETDDSEEDDEDESENDDEDEDVGATSSLRSQSSSLKGTELHSTASPTRKASTMAQEAGAAAIPAPTTSDSKAANAAAAVAAAAEKDYPGPATHAPTECGDQASHFENLLKEDVIPAPLGKVYSMLFGDKSGGWMSRWLVDEAKCWDLSESIGKECKALDDTNKTRSYTYMKPLYTTIGPKQTKCAITEQLDAFDLDKAVSVTVVTQTPDVPSGNVFSTKTRYCLMWGPGNGTRIHMSFTIEWSGKSWIKGPIEKGAKEGQGTYADDLVRALRAGVSSRPAAVGKTKKNKRGKKGDATRGNEGSPTVAPATRKPVRSWGPFEVVRPVVGPVVSIVRPLFSLQACCGFLLFMLVVSWFRNSRLRMSTRKLEGVSGSPGMARSVLRESVQPVISSAWSGSSQYDTIWKREEDALWQWLEERVGLQDGMPAVHDARKANADASKEAAQARQNVLSGRRVKRKGGKGSEGDESGSRYYEGMSLREIEFALQVTKEKIEKMEEMVGLLNRAHTKQANEGEEKEL